MTDAISGFLFEQLDIRGVLVQLGESWRSMHAGRNYAPCTRNMLGEVVSVTALLGSQMKSAGKLVMQLQGHGAIRLLMVDCDDQLRLRGVAKAPADLQPAPPAVLLGDGKLVLTLQGSGQPYQSFVPLEGDSLAGIFENYLQLSVQQPTRLWLAADESTACALFLQKLPDADRCDADGWNRVQQLAATLRPEELILPASDLLSRLFADEELRLFAPRTPHYHCPRDETKVLDMLRGLGHKEVAAIVAEHGAVVIHDDVCNHEYRFGPDIVDQLFPPLPPTLPPTLH